MIKKLDKKGIAGLFMNPIFWIALIIIGILIFVPISFGKPGMPNYNPVLPGCKPVNLGVVVSGNVFVENSALFETEPSIKKTEITEVRAKQLIFSEDFQIRVSVIDLISNNVIATDSIQDKEIDKDDIIVPYSLSFVMPDNSCDGKIDDFEVLIKTELFSEDPGDVTENKIKLRFVDGRWIS